MTTLDLFETDWTDLWGGQPEDAVGAIFTKPEVVDLILDLADYSVGQGRLAERKVLEPSCGEGAFLGPLVSRMVESELEYRPQPDWSGPVLLDAFRAADIDPRSIAASRRKCELILLEAGCPPEIAASLVKHWVRHTDFLLEGWEGGFHLVTGNPPYVRLEALPRQVLASYRKRYSTLTDRADLYVAFFERGLQLLAPDGILAFISANRFTKNRYGAALRRLLAKEFRVRHYLNLEHTQPFLQDVSAYPAVIVVDKQCGLPTRAATLSQCDPHTLNQFRHEPTSGALEVGKSGLFPTWYPDGSPWLTTSSEEYEFLCWLENKFPCLEESSPGTKVGIGVATGADRVFIHSERHPTVEPDRQLPLVLASDIRSNHVEWSGHRLMNPFADSDSGGLVNLAEYPGLGSFFEEHETRLRARHVAKDGSVSWYRTIDLVWSSLVAQPKLLIPDIQAGGIVAFDSGKFYPHHNVYWVTSSTWNLRALQALLRSTIVLRQVRAFSVEMRGGSLRYQAQTLRRLRVPAMTQLSDQLIDALVKVATSDDQDTIDLVAGSAFEYSGKELTPSPASALPSPA